jgi:site-specific DNA-methyltransferase (adenine-specific)
MTKGFTSGMRTSNDDTWTTPRDYYDRINVEFNFTLDAAALADSTLVPDNWYGPDHPDQSRRDAFTRDWAKDSAGPIWLNPPYGRVIKSWVCKANAVAAGGGTVVCLVPARTDTSWWHDYCIHHEVRFIRGRLKFGGQKNSAPFPSALVIMKARTLPPKG